MRADVTVVITFDETRVGSGWSILLELFVFVSTGGISNVFEQTYNRILPRSVRDNNIVPYQPISIVAPINEMRL